MEIKLYKSTAETHRVNKTEYLTEVITLNGTLKEQCSVVNPSINIELNEFTEFNYVYIKEFNRYYFLVDMINVSNNVWRIELSCDVLMSFKDDILSLSALVERQEFDYNPNIIDSTVITDNNPTIDIIEKDIEQFTVQRIPETIEEKVEQVFYAPFALVCVSEV